MAFEKVSRIWVMRVSTVFTKTPFVRVVFYSFFLAGSTAVLKSLSLLCHYHGRLALSFLMS